VADDPTDLGGLNNHNVFDTFKLLEDIIARTLREQERRVIYVRNVQDPISLCGRRDDV
jgi:hypothetical protein